MSNKYLKLTTLTVWHARRHDIKVKGRLRPFIEGVDLFTSGQKWWLVYTGSTNLPTGPFKTKGDAVRWYEHGGR